jgi:hypothetical protein
MTDLQEQEYRQLALDSSNLMLEWGGRWVLGRYEQATQAIRKAGQLRDRMGQMCFADGQLEYAAEDWLSSSDCYLKATDDKRAAAMLQRAEELQAQGHISSKRGDLLADIPKRGEEIRQLRDKVRAFRRILAEKGFPDRMTPDEDTLKFLLQQVRELPGFAPLHLAISRQASLLGHADLAEKHLHWATQFAADPDDSSASNGPLRDGKGKTGAEQERGEPAPTA